MSLFAEGAEFSDYIEDRFDRQKGITFGSNQEWDQKKLKDSKVLVIGAGTLGNEVLKNLALLGVGDVTIIDNDVVKPVNLSRSVLMRKEDEGKNKAYVAAKRMKELYSQMNVTPLNIDAINEFGNCNYRNFNLVLMTVDNLEARIYINRYCHMWKRPLIDGGLDGLLCNVQVIIPPKTACYECTFSSNDYLWLSRKYSCDGSRIDSKERKIPMVITSAAVAAGIMTQEAVKILHNASPTLAGKRLVIDGKTNEFEILSINRRKNCLGHYNIDSDNSIFLKFSNKITLKKLREVLNPMINGEFLFQHDKSILYSDKCPKCGLLYGVIQKSNIAYDGKITCKKCGELLNRNMDGILRCEDMSLEYHGVPENHLLTICQENGERKFLVPI